MLDKVLTTISRYIMLRPGDRVIAAVSGGPDSVCLLEALCEIAERQGITVTGVAHLNHKLRGEASEADERFVAAIAARRGLTFYCEEARVIEAGGNLEQAARRARIKFFGRLIERGAADRIATGHTRDDQAETVLFRLLRGSGLTGLAGILPVTGEGFIRPMLGVSRAEVIEFLRARGIEWREDASNVDARFSRNRIRHSLLPQLEREWNPEIRESLGHLADLAGEEERWWQRKIARLAAKVSIEREAGVEVRADALSGLPVAVARRLVRDLARRAGGSRLEFAHVEKVLRLAGSARGSGCLELPGLVVLRSFDWIRLEGAGAPQPEFDPVPVLIPGRYEWAGGAVCFHQGAKPCAGSKSGEAACARLKWTGKQAPAMLELRGWRDGDHYQPFDRTRDQNITEMFQRARVPSWKRALWPIVTNGSEILWARQFGPAAEFAATSDYASSGRGGGRWLWIWEEKNGGV